MFAHAAATDIFRISQTPLGHDIGEWYVDVEPDCTQEGVKKADCSRCDYYDIEIIDPLGHKFIDETVKSSCVTGGFTTHTCSVCGYKETDGETGALGHDMGEWHITKEPTCVVPGETRRDCNRCEYYETDYINVTDHDYSCVTVDPLCIEQGYDSYSCSVCGNSYRDNFTPALGHNMGDWYTVKEATYTETGLERSDCSRGDYYEQRETDLVPRASFTATFMADGEVVAKVEFLRDAKSVDEPAVPEKTRYTGKWEKYTLKNEDIIINAEYRLITADDDKLSYVDTDKTAEYNAQTGVATINLKASSAAKTIVSNSTKTVPLDIVLVIDRSGSMDQNLGGSEKKINALKRSANSFINTVYENSKATGADHRISIVGFAMGDYTQDSKNFPSYMNTGVLSVPGEEVKMTSKGISKDVYRDSLVYADDNGSVNKLLTNSINGLTVKGATAADLGLEMAREVYANNPLNGEERQRIVVFMTDGEPTNWSNFDTPLANRALVIANELKKAYGADIYSVGVTSDAKVGDSKNLNKFLDYVSSNYPDATVMNGVSAGGDNGYYLPVNNTKALEDVFVDIVINSVTNTTDFTDITLIDTVSKYFTMTEPQEKAFRESVIAKYGIDNSAITVDRNKDGTTTVQVTGLNPYETKDENGKTVFEASISFDVSANSNAINKGVYETNTEDAGVIVGDSESYEAMFKSPRIAVPEDRNIAVFTVNGATYAIENEEKGGKVEAPEFTVPAGCTFSGWSIPENFVMLGRYVTFDAALTDSGYTVVWNIGSEKTVDKYNPGDVITAPEVKTTPEKTFAGWDKKVPVNMPAENLEFTAEYEPHSHSYTSVKSAAGNCTADTVITYTCEACGDVYTETVKGNGSHNYQATVSSSESSENARTSLVCTRCGDIYELNLEFRVQDRRGNIIKTYDMSLLDGADVKQQPDGSVEISVPLNDHQLEKGCTLNVYHVGKDGKLEKVPSTVSGGMLIFTAERFSNYTVIDRDCAEANGGYIKFRKVIYKLVRIFAPVLRMCGAIDTEKYQNIMAKYSFGWVITNIYYYDLPETDV